MYKSRIVTKVELEFENGERDIVDIVIGADGIHSFTAKALHIDDSEPIYAGANIFYGMIDNPDEVPFENDLISQDGHMVTGPSPGHFLAFRVGPADRKLQLWVATYPAAAPPDNRRREFERDTGSSGTRMEDDLRDLLNKFPTVHPIHELVRHTKPENLLHFGLHYRKHKASWFEGRVVLLGDSCHATLPFVGQGANQAIEDAIVLADCLAKTTISTTSTPLRPQGTKTTTRKTATTTTASKGYSETTDDSEEDEEALRDMVALHRAFSDYYRLRFQRTKRVVQMANMISKGLHSRNFVLKWMMNCFQSQMAKGGMVFRQLEREIIEESPIKDYSNYLRPTYAHG